MARWSLPAALLLAGLAFAAATGLALDSMHQSVWREAESRGREVALALANGIARDLARVDVTLRATAFGLGRADPQTDIMEVQRRARQRAAQTSADALVPVVVVLDASGNTLASTGLVAPELLDALQQDAAFRAEAAGAMLTAAISRPLRAGPQAPWHVAVGRGFGPPEGLQGGVVAALVPLEADRDRTEPPPGLARRTLERIARERAAAASPALTGFSLLATRGCATRRPPAHCHRDGGQ
jgi:hypothetical protein